MKSMQNIRTIRMYQLHILPDYTSEFQTSITSFNPDNLSVFVFYQSKLNYTENLLFCLDPNEQKRYSQFYFTKDKYNFLLGRFCVKALAHQLLKLNLNEIVIDQNDMHSKPFISGQPGFFFNISHTLDVVVVAISMNSETGIDIESANNKKGYELVINSYFTENEALKIQNSNKPEKIFKQIWTHKEAVVKLLGSHLLDQIKSFDVSDNYFRFNSKMTEDQPPDIYLHSFELENEIAGCIATVNQLVIDFYKADNELLEKWSKSLRTRFS